MAGIHEGAASADRQREIAVQQARDGLRRVFTCIDQLTSQDKKRDMKNIARASARAGVWSTFSNIYDGNAVNDFIESDKPRERIQWVERFAQGGDMKMAESVAKGLKNEKHRESAY